MQERPSNAGRCADARADAGRGRSPRRTLTRRRKWAFRLAAVTLVPVLCLGLVELALLLCGYGTSTALFVRVPGRDVYTTNNDFLELFYNRGELKRPTPLPCQLPVEKGDNAYRIFVLGGSAPMGYPERAFSFSRILRVMLEDVYGPAGGSDGGSGDQRGPKFEVINLAMSGVNAHIVRQIARQCADYQPDAIIVYTGNNEVIGLFGAGNEGFHRWVDVYRRVQAASKGIQVNCTLDEVQAVMDTLDPRGLFLHVSDVPSREAGESVLRDLASWCAGRVL